MSDRTSPNLTVEIGQDTHDIFMSFGLLNTLSAQITSIDDLTQAIIDPDYREFTLVQCLSERGPEGQIIRPFNSHTLGFEAGELILNWVQRHLEDFFIRRLTQNQKAIARVNQAVI